MSLSRRGHIDLRGTSGGVADLLTLSIVVGLYRMRLDEIRLSHVALLRGPK